jgi:hypothetical protein
MIAECRRPIDAVTGDRLPIGVSVEDGRMRADCRLANGPTIDDGRAAVHAVDNRAIVPPITNRSIANESTIATPIDAPTLDNPSIGTRQSTIGN